MLNSVFASILTFAFLCFSPATSAQEPQVLRWTLKQGEELAVELDQTTYIDTNLDNRKQKIGNEMKLSMSWRVAESNDDQFRIEQQINRIQLTIKAPGKEGVKITNVDTESKTPTKGLAEELLAQVRPLIGAKFIVAMNRRGKILDIEVSDDAMKAVRSAPASMQIRQALTKEGMTNLFGQTAVTFPEEPLAKGDSWKSSATVQTALGTVAREDTFTLSQWQDDMATVSVATTASFDRVKPDVVVSGFQSSGVIRFSPNGQNVANSELSNRLTSSRKYRDKTIRSTVNTKIELKVERK